jgi:hypothetical protein
LKLQENTANPASTATTALENRLSSVEQVLERTLRRVEELSAHSAPREASLTPPPNAAVELEELRREISSARETTDELRRELSAARQATDELSTKLQAEREERIAAIARLGERQELAKASAAAHAAATDRMGPEGPAPLASPGAAAAASRPKPPTAPIFIMPQHESVAPPSFIRALMIKGLLLAAIGGVAATQRDKIAEVGTIAKRLIDMPKTAATQATMGNIVGMMQSDFAEHELPEPGEFVAYVKSHAVANADQAAVDGWGTELHLERSPDVIRSAGPDRIFGTPDDLVAELPKRESTK